MSEQEPVFSDWIVDHLLSLTLKPGFEIHKKETPAGGLYHLSLNGADMTGWLKYEEMRVGLFEALGSAGDELVERLLQ